LGGLNECWGRIDIQRYLYKEGSEQENSVIEEKEDGEKEKKIQEEESKKKSSNCGSSPRHARQTRGSSFPSRIETRIETALSGRKVWGKPLVLVSYCHRGDVDRRILHEADLVLVPHLPERASLSNIGW